MEALASEHPGLVFMKVRALLLQTLSMPYSAFRSCQHAPGTELVRSALLL